MSIFSLIELLASSLLKWPWKWTAFLRSEATIASTSSTRWLALANFCCACSETCSSESSVMS